jgi:hypothetical protein
MTILWQTSVSMPEPDMPSLIRDVHVRFSEEEMFDLERMAGIQQAPVRSIIRAMVRHFVLEWKAGRDVSIELGAVVWKHTP